MLANYFQTDEKKRQKIKKKITKKEIVNLDLKFSKLFSVDV